MTTKERILYFISEIGESKLNFFNKIGIAASNFKGDGMKSELGGEKIVKILTEYPNISPEWLLTGSGPMLKEPSAGVINKVMGDGNITGSSIQGGIVQGNGKQYTGPVGMIQGDGNGHTINNNPNDLANLIKMIEDKDYIIARLRKKIEEQNCDFTTKLEAKECFYNNLLAEKDKIINEKDISCRNQLNIKDDMIKKMMDRESAIVQGSYDRNNENLARMDEMHKRLFILEDTIISLIKAYKSNAQKYDDPDTYSIAAQPNEEYNKTD